MGNVRALACSLLLVVTAGSSVGAAAPADDRPETARVALAPSSLEVPAAPEVPESTPLGFYWQLTMAQPVLPGTHLLTGADGRQEDAGSSTGRSDQQFFEISSTGSNDIPDAALRAYRNAASALSSCGIAWTFVAAIGRVESDHGRFGSSQLGSDGVSRPAIIGLQLNGAGPVAAIRDTDDGALDGDKVWDRAVGQMQFIPGTWAMSARDGDGDGRANPHDLDDSALAAATYLCGAGNLSIAAGMRSAALRYNHSEYYADLVLSFHRGYESGIFEVPAPPPPPKKATTKKVRPAASPRPRAGATSTSASPVPSTKPTPSSTPRPTPSSTPRPRPTPTKSPKPSAPPPSAPAERSLRGHVVACTAHPNELCVKEATGAEVELDLTALTPAASNALVGLVGKPNQVEVATTTPAGANRVKVVRFKTVG